MRVLLLLLSLLMSSFSWAEKTVHLTSLEWPPYSGKQLPQQGASVAVATAAFKAMGYKLVVHFYPWSRSVYLAKRPESRYAGYFPEYYSEQIAQQFIYSKPMGSGPLGFAELTTRPIEWQQLTDLKDKRIGVVQDYVNTKEFDRLVAQGELTVSAVISDTINLKKLVNGRLDLAVIDKHVMRYLFKTEPALSSKAALAQFQPTPLEEKQLYICFKNSAQGQQLADIYNQGLKKIDVQAIMQRYMQEI